MTRQLVLASVVVASLVAATPAQAQFGKILDTANKAVDAKEKFDAINMSDADERKIGDEVSTKLRTRFGVDQDKAVTTYVSLVGTVLAKASTRPNLNWQFIVLDTDGVNAYAAPGGLVHVTRGLLGLMKSEAQLADVLGHEITHITAKHTVRAIQKRNAVQLGAEQTKGGALASAAVNQIAGVVYDDLLANKFDRNDEMEADRVGIAVASKVGYSPSALSDVLKALDARNTSAAQPNGLFASHPDTQARLDGIAKTIKEQKLAGTAIVAARYEEHITWDAKPAAEIPTVDAGAKGLTGGSSPPPPPPPASSASTEKKDDEKDKDKKDAEQPKKKGGFLSKMNLSGGSQAQSSQTVASAGGRAVGNDNNAKGGSNPQIVGVTITPADLEAFKKGIVG
jgi:Zn-dependent protease with chaperone function